MLRRKLVKNKYSGQVTLPKDFLKNLGWDYGDTLFIRQVGENILLSNHLIKKKRII